MSRERPAKGALIQAVFMLVTTVGALVLQISGYIGEQRYLLGSIGVALIVLAAFMAYEGLVAIRALRAR